MKRIIAALVLVLPSLAWPCGNQKPQEDHSMDGFYYIRETSVPLTMNNTVVKGSVDATTCPPGQHIGPRDKDDGYRECVPDRPKRPEPPPKKPVIHKPACPDPCKQCPACILKAEECPDCICNPAPSVTLPYIGDPYEAEVEYREPYSSLPPPGHWVTGAGVFRLPSARTIVSWDVIVEEREVDPRLTIRESARWMPFVSAGWEFSGGTRLLGHVGYVLGGDTRVSRTDLHYGSYRRVRGLDVRDDSGGVSVGVSVERTWK